MNNLPVVEMLIGWALAGASMCIFFILAKWIGVLLGTSSQWVDFLHLSVPLPWGLRDPVRKYAKLDAPRPYSLPYGIAMVLFVGSAPVVMALAVGNLDPFSLIMLAIFPLALLACVALSEVDPLLRSFQPVIPKSEKSINACAETTTSINALSLPAFIVLIAFIGWWIHCAYSVSRPDWQVSWPASAVIFLAALVLYCWRWYQFRRLFVTQRSAAIDLGDSR